MRVFFSIAGLCLTVLFTNLAHARDIEANSVVTDVTIFPSGAEIVRSVKVNLVRGDQTVVIQDLPERLVGSSLRVEGMGGEKFEIGSVDAKRIFVDVAPDEAMLDKSERKRLEKMIEQLGDEVSLLSARIKAAQTQRTLMERLTDLPGQSRQTPVAGSSNGGGSQLYSVENWGQIFDLIGTRLAVADDQILKYQQQQRQKLKDVTKLKKRLSQQPPKKERQMEVRVAIAADVPMKARLKIKYQLREASWRPFYDARLTTGEGGGEAELSLTRRAAIRQWSGEDWTDVKISLSTTRPQQGAQAPILHPKRLDLQQDYPVAQSAAKPASGYGGGRSMRGVMRNEMMADQVEAAPEPKAAYAPKRKRLASVMARERRAAVRQFAFQAVFEIPGKTTVLPTGDEKKVAISTDKIKPVLKIKTVPKLNRAAYLYAKFTHMKNAVPLLQGSVALYRDGTYTGNGFMKMVRAGEKFALGFGVDDAIKVEHNEVKRTKGESGVWSSSKTDERRYKIKITNLHSIPVDVEVMDRIPYSVNEKIVVQMLSSSTRASRKNIKDKRGIIAWDFKLPAGGEKQINLDYTISWPADKTLRR